MSNGHLQATGRDAKKRKQYRYHPQWRAIRDATKYGRMRAFGAALPLLRKRVEHDLALPGHSRESVLAAVVRLLESTLIRVGNEEYVRANRSFGLTTLRDKHVEISGSTLTFQFRGKSGKQHTVGIADRRLARILKQCQELPGQELFQYVDGQGIQRTICSTDVNAYLREIAGEDFTAKDFRTWVGTVLTLRALWESGDFDSPSEAKKTVVRVIAAVAARLGNTPAMARKYYVHPVVLETYMSGKLRRRGRRRSERPSSTSAQGLRAEEIAFLALIDGAR